jgi:transposase
MADPADAFVPVVFTESSATLIVNPVCPAPDAVIIPPSRLRVQLPSGVTLKLDCTGRNAMLVSTVVETLGRCDVPSRR